MVAVECINYAGWKTSTYRMGFVWRCGLKVCENCQELLLEAINQEAQNGILWDLTEFFSEFFWAFESFRLSSNFKSFQFLLLLDSNWRRKTSQSSNWAFREALNISNWTFWVSTTENSSTIKLQWQNSRTIPPKSIESPYTAPKPVPTISCSSSSSK